jgi:4-hydroxy-2-oxoheptanedioate aldolase
MIQPALWDKLHDHKPGFGLAVKFDDPAIVEVIGAGWDFVWLDMQHGSIGTERIEDLLRACDLIGVSAFVRPPGPDPQTISQILNMNAAGVIVPQIDDAVQAEAIVRAAKFPPLGDRSYGGPRIHFRQGPDYPTAANERQLVIAQIESPTAVANADAIAATDGIDVLMLAPDDLRLRLGVPLSADFASDELLQAADKVITACRHHGKIGFALAFEADAIRAFLERGYRLLLAAADARFLQEGAARAHRVIDPLR